MDDTLKFIFVFGSNLAGIHGAGAAKHAVLHHGAKRHIGVGPTGQAYAIPTKSCSLTPLPLDIIEGYVKQFRQYALKIMQLETFIMKDQGPPYVMSAFQVTRVGCGLAGYKDHEVAPLFKDMPANCWFDIEWKPYLGDKPKYWGTF